MRALVTGGAGFLGSHLCERLLAEGWDVTAVDSYLTGSLSNLQAVRDDPRLRTWQADVGYGVPDGSYDAVLHLASPASPLDYQREPLATLRAGSAGTLNALRIAYRRRAVFLLASTSEVYGDPEEHPQREDYWGNVNPIGPRSVYDEAKRFSEAATSAYARKGLDARIARIFNTYGPRMRMGDGRVVPTFVEQCLRGEPMTIQGTGEQTRSLCYVDDLVEGLWRLLTAKEGVPSPVNLGNPREMKVVEIAYHVARAVGVPAVIKHTELPEDDPHRRCPDITRARTHLRWEPQWSLEEGLRPTVEWFRERL